MKIQNSKFKIQNFSLQFKTIAKIVNFTFLIVTLHFALCTLHLPKAYAEGISLSVSPAILQIKAIPPADTRAPFIIENKSDEPIKLKIGYKLFKSSEKGDGQVVFLKDEDSVPGADKKIFEKIDVIDNNFSIDSLKLGPKQKKSLMLRIITPKKDPSSDYYFSLIFLTEPSSDKDEQMKEKISTATTTGGIAINVLLSIGPNNNPKGYIEQFSTPWYRESGPVPFSLKVKNAGSHFIAPEGVILLKNMFGQTVGKLDIAPQNVLAGTSRFLSNNQLEHKPSQQEGEIAIVWPETFLLGFYTASLSLAISDNGPIYTNDIHFFAFPIKGLIGIAIAIAVLMAISVKIRQRIKGK